MIGFFTFLTFFSAYFNKVTDCGCFGDALKITPWQSFFKDVVLLFFILIIFMSRNKIQAFFTKKAENTINIFVLILCTSFVWHTFSHLPTKDFRPYAIGKNISEGMKSCNELGLPCTEQASIYIVKDISLGGKLSKENIRIIRPGHGLAPKYYNQVLGRAVNRKLKKGTAVKWDYLTTKK